MLTSIKQLVRRGELINVIIPKRREAPRLTTQPAGVKQFTRKANTRAKAANRAANKRARAARRVNR